MSHYSLGPHTVVAVIGAGSMGTGIAQLAAQAGHRVGIFDQQPTMAQQALERIEADLARAASRGYINKSQGEAILQRIFIATNMQQLSSADLVIEAIVEQLESKRALFAELEKHVKSNTILASNTSSLSITALAYGLQYTNRVVGWHFFNPATRMKLVEIIPGVDTDPDLLKAMHQLSHSWGKIAVDAPNTPGFIVNRVARPYYAEGLRLLAEGITSLEVIDYIARDSGGFAMGPFELMDLIGVDVNLSVTESVFSATAYDTRYAPHVIQQELVRAGRWGRKKGIGFYDYHSSPEHTARQVALPIVTPVSDLSSLTMATEMGLLSPLIERLQAADIPLTIDPRLAAQTLQLHTDQGNVIIALTDGRTATECAQHYGMPYVLLDLSHNFERTALLAITASPLAQAYLPYIADVFQKIEIRLVKINDVAGMVITRLVSCIINEAAELLTWTRTLTKDIDTAMRLGTAYPYGPLAWADKLTAQHVVQCLIHLKNHYGDMRYRCAPKLKELCFTGERFHD